MGKLEIELSCFLSLHLWLRGSYGTFEMGVGASWWDWGLLGGDGDISFDSEFCRFDLQFRIRNRIGVLSIAYL